MPIHEALLQMWTAGGSSGGHLRGNAVFLQPPGPVFRKGQNVCLYVPLQAAAVSLTLINIAKIVHYYYLKLAYMEVY